MLRTIKSDSIAIEIKRLRTPARFSAALIVAGLIWAQNTPVFSYQVTRAKPLAPTRLQRGEPGRLQFSETGILYKSENGKTTLDLPYADVKGADVSDPRKIRIETYDIRALNPAERRTYEFKTTEDHGPDLARFLAEHVQRPVIGDSGDSTAKFRVSAYHRHLAGGAHGILEIGNAGIRFATKSKADSRTWLYRDIDTIGSSGPFNFRVTTAVETYNFDLKERLPEAAYDWAWQRTYGLTGVRDSESAATNLVPNRRFR